MLSNETGEHAMSDVAAVKWINGEQFVILPEGFEFKCRRVRIWREGSSVVLEPTETQSADQTIADDLPTIRYET